MDAIRHWSHHHPLFLREYHPNNDERHYCYLCHKHIPAPNSYYVCDKCKFYVHKSCAELPQQIKHSFHPSHSLTLLFRSNFYCDSCHKEFDYAPTYKCEQCNFDMDVECALMPPIICEGQDHIQHFSHQHPMSLVEIDGKDEIKCFGCHLTCSSGMVYGCTKCEHFLHKSCAKLPLKIQHPLYTNHYSLFLRVANKRFTCELCHKADNVTLTFKCHDECGFQLCVKCGEKDGKSTIKGTIRYEDHEHLLSFQEETCTKFGQCNSNNTYCKQPIFSNSMEVHHISSSIFRCWECGFKVHLLCGLLPSTITYEYHIHPLILLDSLVEDNSGEYCCDICESKRDSRIRVYYCEDCKYVAHIHCVISEIINVLRGDLSHVKLRTIGTDYWESHQEINNNVAGVAEDELAVSSITFKDLINYLRGDELEWFKDGFEWDTSSNEGNKGDDEEVSQSTTTDDQLIDLRDEYIDELLKFSSFTEKDFENFNDELRRNYYKGRKLKIRSSDLALKIIEVKGYMVPFTFVPFLKMLLHKYGGDIAWDSYISLEMKSIVLFFLCKMMKQMHSTRVIDITKDLLLDWYFYLQLAKLLARTDFGFLEASLKKSTSAFVGSNLRKFDGPVLRAINKKIDALKLQQDQYENKLELCQKFRQQSTSKPKFMMECLNDAAEFEWKTASEFFSLY